VFFSACVQVLKYLQIGHNHSCFFLKRFVYILFSMSIYLTFGRNIHICSCSSFLRAKAATAFSAS